MPRSLIVLVVATAALLTMLLWGGESAETSRLPSDADQEDVAAASTRPSGTLVFMARPNRLTAIDVASGRRTSRTMSSVATCSPQFFVSGGRVIFAGVQKRRTTVFSVPTTLDRPPTRLGAAHIFVPSAHEGRVWLAGTDCTQTGMIGAREVTVDGRVTLTTSRRVPGEWVDGAVDRGLVIVRDRKSAIWNPRTGHIRRPLGLEAVSATGGPLLAGCSTRSHCRELAILDTRAAKLTVARPIPRYRLDVGAKFSPDRSLLAAPAYAHRRWRIALVSTRSGATRLIPGTGTGTVYPRVSWTSTGWLYVTGRGRHILAYRPGSPRAVTLPFRTPRQVHAFAAG